MTKVIGFAGSKQSGKNTACNYIMAMQLQRAKVCRNVALNDTGDIIVSDIFGEQILNMPWVPLTNEFVNVEGLFNDFKECKIYALADPLKRVAIDLLGLPANKVYGSDKDKNTLTSICWENMPGIAYGTSLVYHEPGPMTIREVLQYLGTDIFRKMVPDIWMRSLMRNINKDRPPIALVSDVRFDNEITGLQKQGAYIFGLTRHAESQDNHASEIVNLDLCDTIIDNVNMSIQEKCDAMNPFLEQILTS